MHGLDFDGIDPLALIGAEDDLGLVNSSVLEPICPSCRCSMSSFLSRMMETQHRPVLDDWPIHQRLFESMHKRCIYGVKQRCLFPVSFAGTYPTARLHDANVFTRCPAHNEDYCA